MKVICLFAQQKCDYPGQYLPDLRAAIDENSDSDNPDFLTEEEEALRKDSSVDFYRRITITIDDKEFDKAFYPQTISGAVCS